MKITNLIFTFLILLSSPVYPQDCKVLLDDAKKMIREANCNKTDPTRFATVFSECLKNLSIKQCNNEVAALLKYIDELAANPKLIDCGNKEKYFITFCADGGIPGHAFVSLGRESPSSSSSINDGTWGLYPANSSDGAASIIGPVPGQLKDDFLRNKDHIFVIEVLSSEYERVKLIISKWKNKDYRLVESDCLSFLIEVANIFKDKINIPSRSGLENLPARFLKKMIDSN